MLYTQLFEQLEYCATVKHNQHLPVPVRFILDEFYNTGKIPNFENILSYARSFGIGISIILQSLDQIKEMYEKSWGTIWDNCSVRLYLGGIGHVDTLKYISELLGKGTFDKRSYSRTKSMQGSFTTSNDKIGRELLDPAEVGKLDKDRCLLFINGYQPFNSWKLNCRHKHGSITYKTHPNYKYTSDADKKNEYRYKTPAELAELEAEKVESLISTRGEEVSSGEVSLPVFEKTPLIVLNTNEDEVLQTLRDNILSLDFESGEEVALSADEEEEARLLQEILADEEAEKEKVSVALREVTPLIEMDTRVETVEAVAKEFLADAENVDFVTTEDLQDFTPVDLSSDAEEAEEWEDDTDDTEDTMRMIESSLGGLYDNMVSDHFLDDLEEADINSLKEGGTEETEEETEAV